jgi:hypothetical protein
MTNQATLCEINAECEIVNSESKRKDQKSQLKKAFIDFICSVVGKPDYSFTLTLNPVEGPRRTSTKINDAGLVNQGTRYLDAQSMARCAVYG